LFKKFFERIVLQWAQAGLVDGRKIFMDGSIIDADASNNSVVDTHSLKRYLKKGYAELTKRLEEKDGAVNTRFISATDPDASIVRHGKGKPKLTYKTHRAVDGRHEIITAVTVTPGSISEGYKMDSLIRIHEVNTDAKVRYPRQSRGLVETVNRSKRLNTVSYPKVATLRQTFLTGPAFCPLPPVF
jgi:hypothetical protein